MKNLHITREDCNENVFGSSGEYNSKKSKLSDACVSEVAL